MCREDHIRGALIGIAMGDAMGMPSEMMSREDIKEKIGEITGFLPSSAGTDSRKLSAGETTDDTANSILVVQLLAAHNGKVDQHDFVLRLLDWASHTEKSSCVMGPSTRTALERIKAGIPLHDAGKNGNTNGAAMKIIPVGLVNRPDSLEKLVEQVHLLCMPTHNTGLAIGAAAAVAAAASGAIYEQMDWDDLWKLVLRAAAFGEKKGYYAAGASVEATIRRAMLRIREMMASPQNEVLDMIYREIGTGLSSSETAAAALSLACYSKNDPCLCAKLCANVGGDTDTIGAIACGICGAYSGSAAFSKEDIDMLEKVNNIDFQRLAHSLDQAAL